MSENFDISEYIDEKLKENIDVRTQYILYALKDLEILETYQTQHDDKGNPRELSVFFSLKPDIMRPRSRMINPCHIDSFHPKLDENGKVTNFDEMVLEIINICKNNEKIDYASYADAEFYFIEDIEGCQIRSEFGDIIDENLVYTKEMFEKAYDDFVKNVKEFGNELEKTFNKNCNDFYDLEDSLPFGNSTSTRREQRF